MIELDIGAQKGTWTGASRRAVRVENVVLMIAAMLLVSGEVTRIDAPKYSLDVPKGWTVGAETPWGARDIVPSEGKGKLGAMTAGPTDASWKSLYDTSLGFILRERKGKATPFRLGKSKSGYESMSFEVLDADGFADRRYVVLKNKGGNALALSVRIPSRKAEPEYVAAFRRMVDSALIKE